MTPLRTLIVDDEPPARRALEILLSGLPQVKPIGAAADGLEALALIAADRVDLLLADIAMPNLSGLQLVAQLPPDRAPVVVFVTAYAEHAVTAFDLGAADYLLKPVSPERLARALARAVAQAATPLRLWAGLASLPVPIVTPTHIWVDVKGGRARVPVTAIDVLRAEDDFVRIITSERSYLTAGPLDRLAAELGQGFLRVHRSTVIRIAAVRAISSDPSRRLLLTMASGEVVMVSRRGGGRVRSCLRLPMPANGRALARERKRT